jgi:PAS domain S-box-containing protein
LAAIVDSTDEAVYSVNGSHLITSWNRGAERLFGYRADELVGAPLSLLLPPGADTSGLEAALRGEPGLQFDVMRLRKDGDRVFVAETISPMRDADGDVVGAAILASDISSRVGTQRALAVTRRELEDKNRRLERSNADLEQFAYVASHDLSEPLRAVAGMVALLARRYRGRLDADADDFIGFAVDGCERMRRMIEDLLVLSRVGRVEHRLEQLDTGTIVATVVETLAAQLEEAGGAVRWADLPVVTGDRAQLTRVFQNLISNAIKFRRSDVPVVVEVSAAHEPEGQWRFLVSDNGIGIEEQYRNRIFQMFQRLHTSDVYSGSGIGLAVAERIIDRHGGTIGMISNPGGGSTFWFTLPDAQTGSDPWNP